MNITGTARITLKIVAINKDSVQVEPTGNQSEVFGGSVVLKVGEKLTVSYPISLSCDFPDMKFDGAGSDAS